MTASPVPPTERAYQQQVLRAHEDLRSALDPARGTLGAVRAPVLESWVRSIASLAARGAAAVDPAVVDDDLEELRREHLFARVLPLLRDRLIDPAVSAGLVVALGDAGGRLLWVEGQRSMLSRAERMGFAPGVDWSERAMGTSAPALALSTSAAAQVVGAEHFVEAVHPWSCSAVPVLHPLTRQTLGVIDVTGGEDAVAPLVLPLLASAARAAEEELRSLLAEESAGRGGSGSDSTVPTASSPRSFPIVSARPAAEASPAARLLVLGRRTPLLVVGGEQVELSGRHAELLTLLHRAGDGLSGGEIAQDVHDSGAAEGTVRAELVRLRKVLAALPGPEASRPGLASRPYRLTGGITSDLHEAREAITRGDVDQVLASYRGALLPSSDAPAIRDLRERTAALVHQLLMDNGSWDQLWRYSQLPEAREGEDVLMAVLSLAPPDAPERAEAVVRLEELRGTGL
ncbi:phytochrome sensor protein [Brachybacterium sp. SGAir0954]|uniref:helix-turn-helix domain-containing protein n=1 Tax=Brachybacterium sp. SGAir0954 TaxID=2571029 RepID=UPI0010CD2FE6|nr:helix-turn-helix domain-containing protein [Brachybacterium sp. SGAir0954]QCR52129.1 phytochrome sensor protein [Brachybacterium sp. SGAir0954]